MALISNANLPTSTGKIVIFSVYISNHEKYRLQKNLFGKDIDVMELFPLLLGRLLPHKVKVELYPICLFCKDPTFEHPPEKYQDPQ